MATAYSIKTLEVLRCRRDEVHEVLGRYGATNARLFGSVAQGTAGPDSDVDILLDLTEPGRGSRLSRLAGIRLDLEELLQMHVDVVSEDLLKSGVSEAARRQAIAL